MAVLPLLTENGHRHVLLGQRLLKPAQSTELANLTVDLLLDALLQLLLGDLEKRVFGRFLKDQLLVDELVQGV